MSKRSYTDTDPRGERSDGPETPTDRPVLETPILDAELPEELRTALGRFVGERSVGTLGEWARAVRDRTGGGPIGVDALCRVERETGHWGEIDDERHHFACFYDAVILSVLTGSAVDIRTESPAGTVVRARATGGRDLAVRQEGAVASFGIDDRSSASTGEPTLEDGYAAICPYVRAFPTVEAYDRWASALDVPTVAFPLEGATELADALVE